MRGHLIDRADTITSGDPRFWSTKAKAVYIPEPPNRCWGMDIRRLEVDALRRSSHSAYAQFVCYPETPLVTHDGTAVPSYTYFYPYTIEGAEVGAAGVNTYHVKPDVYSVRWDEDLARRDGGVLAYARGHYTTSVDAAPVVTPYRPIWDARTLRHHCRDLHFRANQIAGEAEAVRIRSRFPESDELYARYGAGDMEFENADREVKASSVARREDERRVSRNYIYRAVEHGSELVEADVDRSAIFSEESAKIGEDVLRAEAALGGDDDHLDMEGLEDHFRRLTI